MIYLFTLNLWGDIIYYFLHNNAIYSGDDEEVFMQRLYNNTTNEFEDICCGVIIPNKQKNIYHNGCFTDENNREFDMRMVDLILMKKLISEL